MPLFRLRIYVKVFVIPQIFSKSIDIWLLNFAHLFTIITPTCKQEEVTVSSIFFYYQALRIVERCCPTDSSCFYPQHRTGILPGSRLSARLFFWTGLKLHITSKSYTSPIYKCDIIISICI
jgi:hypothetical protein